MGRYIDGHTPTRSNPDVDSTLLTVGIVFGAGILLIEWLKRQNPMIRLGSGPGGILNPDTWTQPNPEVVPGSAYMDATGHWCWTDTQTGQIVCDPNTAASGGGAI